MRMRSIRKKTKQPELRPVTAQRQLLLSLIREAGGHINAKELYKLASSKNKSISLATVYRALQLFEELGLIEERRLGQVYCYYEAKESSDHQHLVCRSCGKVIEFESPLLRELIDKVQHDHAFNPTKIEVCMEGYCQQCDKDVSNRTEVDHFSKMPLDQRDRKKARKRISGEGRIQKKQKRKQ